MDFQSRYTFNPKTDLLDKGSFSKVYKAWDQLLERDVALKYFGTDVSEKYEVLNMIKKVIRFEHPNLCKYYDVAVLETQNVMGERNRVEVGILEYLDGGNLRKFVAQFPEYTDRLLVDILQGLSYLHKKGMVHGDLKPQNVLIKSTEDGPVTKITDFGLSKLINSSEVDSNTLMGSVEYMAPEQLNPKKYGVGGKIATNLDLWSFGLLVYEVVARKPLFGSRNSGIPVEQVMNDILSDTSLTKLDMLPAKYKAIVLRCLVKNAAERVQVAAELIPLFSLHDDSVLPLQTPMSDPSFSSELSKNIEALPILDSVCEQVPSTPNKPADGPEHMEEAGRRPTDFSKKPSMIYLSEPKRFNGAEPAPEVFISDTRAAAEVQHAPRQTEDEPWDTEDQVTRCDEVMPGNSEWPWPALEKSSPNRPKKPMGKRTPSYIKRRNKRKWVAAIVFGVALFAGIAAILNARNESWESGGETEVDEPAFIPSESVTFEMVRVEGGQFLMGSDALGSAPEEQPVHTAVVPPFFIGKYEVTIGEFRQFVQETGYVTDAEKEGWSSVYKDKKWSKPNVENKVNWRHDIVGNLIVSNVTDIPVVHVSWNDAINYCQWLSQHANSLYRLPTEEEWEFAARGGNSSQSFRFSGSNMPQQVAWYGGNSEGTLHPVGRKEPNELGIHDMSGNAMEWCGSSYKMYKGGAEGITKSSDKVLRGGSWYYDEDWCRSTFRRGGPPNMRGGAIGFRVCREEK